jgi:hypothetical protein
MGNGYLPAGPGKNPGPPARQSAVCGEDVVYFSICSGGAIIKISAADRPKFVLGQPIIFGAIVVVALIELTLWLVNCGYDPLTARPIRGVLVRAANRQPRRQLPVSGKTGMFDFVEAARSRLDPEDRTSPASHRHGWRGENQG